MPWGDDEVNEVNDEVKQFQGMMKKTFSVARVFFVYVTFFFQLNIFIQ